MIGFSGILYDQPTPASQYEDRLKEMTSALEGDQPSTLQTIELLSNRGSEGILAFITNRIQPIIVEDDRWMLIMYGRLYDDQTSNQSDILSRSLFEANEVDFRDVLRLNGGFTLFKFNKQEGALQVYRDRGGIKTVFYHHAEKATLLSSGLRGIAKSSLFTQKDLDLEGLWTNIAYPAPNQPLTCFKHAHVLDRGAFLNLYDGSVSVGKYWEIPSRNIDENMRFEDAVALTHETLNTATKRRVGNGVRIGSTLSGGVDSAYLTALAHHHDPSVEAFTFKVKGAAFDAMNEDDVASLTAKKHGITHHIKAFEYEDFTSELKMLVRLYEQPGISLGAYYSIASIARDLNYDHVINGLSADELFGGFHYFKHLEYWQWLRLLNPVAKLLPPNLHKGIDKFKRIAGASTIDEYYARSFASYLDEELKALFTDANYRSIDIQQRLYNPSRAPFPDATSGLMHYMFSNCPNHHLYRFENFSNHLGVMPVYPFLDNDVIDAALNIPSRHKVRGHKRKIVLKQAAAPWVVQPALTEAKKGVGAPLNAWIDNKLSDLTKQSISQLKQRGIFNADYLDKVVLQYPAQYGKKTWKLVLTELWMQEFID